MSKMDPNVVVRKFYALESLAHAAHVNTRVGTHHEALGEFYEAVGEIKDRIIEHMMGKGKLQAVRLGILEIGEDIKTEARAVSDMFCEYAEMCDDDALENIAGEFEEKVYKLMYMLMMS